MKGTYIWANGKRYEGEWEDGERSGSGVMYSGRGDDRYEGTWSRGRPVGSGVLYQVRAASTSTYTYGHSQSKRETSPLQDGTAVPVEWRDGRPHPKRPYVKRPDWRRLVAE